MKIITNHYGVSSGTVRVAVIVRPCLRQTEEFIGVCVCVSAYMFVGAGGGWKRCCTPGAVITGSSEMPTAGNCAPVP